MARADILRFGEPRSGDRLVRLVAGFVDRARRAHGAEFPVRRFSHIETLNESLAEYSIDELRCADSRIGVLDRGAAVACVALRLRYVGYSCIEFPDAMVGGTVRCSERGREEDLADAARFEDERSARAATMPSTIRTNVSGSGAKWMTNLS